jgi:murein DD-endopeptidase MepM/ murein hydrolase activator NlpD
MPSPSRRPVKTALGVTVGGLLVAAGAFAMVQPDKSVLPKQQIVSDTLVFELPPLEARDTRALTFEQKVETRVQSGDTVASILARLGVKEDGFMAFISSEPLTRKAARRLVPGRSVQAALDADGGMKWIRYYHTPITDNDGRYQTEYLLITKNDDGSFAAEEVAADTDSQMHLAAGRITSSLFGATDAAGVPDGVTMQMAEVLGGKVDFLRDIRKGDEFRVLYETRSFEGRPAGSGRVLAIQYINDGKLVEAMWFAPEGQNGGYYDSEGKSLKAAFLRSAIPFTRVSSKFGKRKHPIHKRWKMHNGIDFAAPTGTPIRATGDGMVDYIGRKGGFGKTIILRHPNNIKTLYAHQSRFAKGLNRGDRVSQGEIIGYVGSTGWSTGPHLHYEFRVNNKPVNPLGIKMPEAVKLDDTQRQEFMAHAMPWRDQLERIAELEQIDGNVQVAAR